jgi:predicted 2-oxoglutarate/Fe(II)-dependent dioxygenase YbiX
VDCVGDCAGREVDWFAAHQQPEYLKSSGLSQRRQRVRGGESLATRAGTDMADHGQGGLRDKYVLLGGFPLQPEEGLLIAFPSRMMHEVQPVTRGKRYSIVTWYS